VLGGVGGVLLGYRLVKLYHVFFRFPHLEFRFDRSALLLALVVSAGAATAGVFSAVRRAARLPPAEAMRPEPPANYRPALIERTGIGRWLSHTFRIAVRNIERRPAQAFFTVAGLALATAILIIPNCFRDGVNEILEFQWDVVQREDVSVGLVEPSSVQARHLFRQLPGALSIEPFRNAFVRLRFGSHRRQLAIRGMPAGAVHGADTRLAGRGQSRGRPRCRAGGAGARQGAVRCAASRPAAGPVQVMRPVPGGWRGGCARRACCRRPG